MGAHAKAATHKSQSSGPERLVSGQWPGDSLKPNHKNSPDLNFIIFSSGTSPNIQIVADSTLICRSTGVSHLNRIPYYRQSCPNNSPYFYKEPKN